MFGKIIAYHGTRLVEAEIIASELPEIMPLVSDGIDNLGSGYTLAPGSTMIVTSSGKRYILGTDGEWSELASGSGGEMPIEGKTSSSPVTDSASGMVQGLTIYGRSKKSKNLLEITAKSQTVNGVTFTIDKAAGTITANGTNTGTSNIYFRLKGSSAVDLPAGTYHLSGGVDLNGVILYNDGHGLIDTGEGSEATFDTETSYPIIIRITPNTTLTNAIFRPMLCTAADYEADPTFEPYFEGIKSVGDNGLMVTTANGDNTLTTSAEITTALPLRGVSDTVRDKLTCTAEKKQVETVCGSVRLADLTWAAGGSPEKTIYYAYLPQPSILFTPNLILTDSKYTLSTTYWTAGGTNVYGIIVDSPINIGIVTNDYTTVSDFVASLGDAELVYELAEPITTPLTTAEISAFRSLRTYDNTTNITISDSPEFELDYLKNSENGRTIAKIQADLQAQINALREG